MSDPGTGVVRINRRPWRVDVIGDNETPFHYANYGRAARAIEAADRLVAQGNTVILTERAVRRWVGNPRWVPNPDPEGMHSVIHAGTDWARA